MKSGRRIRWGTPTNAFLWAGRIDDLGIALDIGWLREYRSNYSRWKHSDADEGGETAFNPWSSCLGIVRFWSPRVIIDAQLFCSFCSLGLGGSHYKTRIEMVKGPFQDHFPCFLLLNRSIHYEDKVHLNFTGSFAKLGNSNFCAGPWIRIDTFPWRGCQNWLWLRRVLLYVSAMNWRGSSVLFLSNFQMEDVSFLCNIKKLKAISECPPAIENYI